MAVIGVVLLIGLVAVASVGILAVGGNIQDETRDEVNREQIRQTFLQLDKEIDSVSRSNSRYREIDFELPSNAESAVRRENTGTIVIERTNITNTKTVVVQNIGSLVYDGENVHYAYQAGAVWSGTGNETQLVSAPSISYATTTDGGDPTLTLPITDLEGPSRINTGGLKLRKLRTEAPVNNVSTIANQLVTVKITSDYYVGWGRYFEDHYENVVVSYNHSASRVIIELGSTDIPGTWNTAIGATGDVTFDGSGSDYIIGNITTGGDFRDTSGGPPGSSQPTGCDTNGDGTIDSTGSDCVDENTDLNAPTLDSAIASKTESILNSCSDSGIECYPGKGLHEVADGTGAADLQGGTTYYFGQDSLVDGPSIQADLSTGNVTVILDGELGIRGAEIEAQNADQGPNCCYLRIYFNGTDMAMANGAGLHSQSDNATRVQLYATSNYHLDAKNIQSGEGWHAALYAPGNADTTTNHALTLSGGFSDVCSADVCFGSGSGTVDGAVVGGSIWMGNSVNFEYDTALQNIERTLGQGGIVPPPITFLHVSVNKVCVGENEC